jgi:hypothetical protein
VPITNPRYSVLQDGTLMIANAVLDDVGAYECVAKNTAGQSKSRSAIMRVGRTVGTLDFSTENIINRKKRAIKRDLNGSFFG